ncbi:MAG TPA: AI-2E family transporter, partial [Paenirhodobacter sp.]
MFRRPLISDISAARWLLLGIIAASVYFFYGFLVPVLAAGVIALASWPIRQWAVARFSRTGAAAILVLLIVCFLVVPITMALVYAFGELQSWTGWLFEVNSAGAVTPRW